MSITKSIAIMTLTLSMAATGPLRSSGAKPGQQIPSRAPFSLEFPELGGIPITAVEAHVPTTELRTMKLTVRQPFADAINYGKIYTAINGESANTICGDIKANRNGKVITCDLESKPRFHFQPGKNVVEISATDRDNNSYYASYVLIAGKESVVNIASPATSKPVLTKFSGRKFAVIIGVSRYQFHDAGLNDLQYADADARSIRDFLLQPNGGGFKASDIIYMENNGATSEVVRDALTRLLPKAGPNDLVFIYIASHGSPDPFDPQKLYFLMNDTKVANMPGSGLGMFELQEVLDHMVRAERVVVFLDACHSAGVAGTKLVTGRQLERLENNVFNLYASKLYRETGRAVLTSSDVNEISEESSNWGGGHGVFTWALLEGLRGAADANRDHVVTAGELFNYVSKRVSQETSSRQNPRALSGMNKDFPLSAVAGR
ncbi:MAG TPA: caspase family protein [Pyrinomonadaceae bacterium]|nr:caspase family protein [Pyrinomonadaceae bacterium]